MKMVVRLSNFINNVYVPTVSQVESFNPSTGKLLYFTSDSGKEEADMAVTAANQAFKTWSLTSTNYRAQILNKIADEIEKRLEEFAVAESSDQGKPVSLSRNIEIPRAIQNFRFFASAILNNKNESTQSQETKTLNFTTTTPAGVAVLISPWNLPLYLLSWKIAPCIASGCTCVCKPSEFTSWTAHMLCDAFLKAGLPEGVVNMVFGYGHKIGNDLVTHPDILLISFTGGTVTGKKIKSSTANQPRKKLSMELGGKNPGIVFPDANIDKLINEIGRSCFQNSGQICLCSSRYYVHADILDKFVDALKKYARSLKIGNPLKPETKMGPVVSKQHYHKVMSYINLAIKNGHHIVCGETVDKLPDECEADGCYILPTIITNLSDSSELMKEEIFGPVVCVTSFQEENEVISRANDNNYGLAATVWSQDISRAHRVANALQSGYVWINCFLVRDLNMPFGGVKDSGTGREGYPYSLEFFTEQKTTCVFYG